MLVAAFCPAAGGFTGGNLAAFLPRKRFIAKAAFFDFRQDGVLLGIAKKPTEDGFKSFAAFATAFAKTSARRPAFAADVRALSALIVVCHKWVYHLPLDISL